MERLSTRRERLGEQSREMNEQNDWSDWSGSTIERSERVNQEDE